MPRNRTKTVSGSTEADGQLGQLAALFILLVRSSHQVLLLASIAEVSFRVVQDEVSGWMPWVDGTLRLQLL